MMHSRQMPNIGPEPFTWILFIDGSFNGKGSNARIILKGPDQVLL